jgi:acyl-CoA thioesterase YciA
MVLPELQTTIAVRDVAAGPVHVVACFLRSREFPAITFARRLGQRMSDTHDRPRGELTVRTIAMPADTNANGDIFGGWVMAHMDQAGGIAGVERAQGRVVTVVVEAMTFIQAMRVGDVLEVYTEVESVGRTSMKIHIEAWAQRFQTHRRDKVTDATFTFVHVGDDGRPRPIPPVSG